MLVNETLETIKQRRSIRSYGDEQIRDEELQAVLAAALYAPNAGGQAWHLTAVQNKDLLRRRDLAAKVAAKQMDMGQLRDLGNNEQFDCLYGAPTLIIVSGDGRAPMPLDADCSAATQNMLLAAESVGLGSCWIFFVLLAFYSPQAAELRRELKIPEGYKPYCSAVLGYKRDSVVSIPDMRSNLITYIG